MACDPNDADELFSGSSAEDDFLDEDCPICEMMRFEDKWDKWEREMRAFENYEDLDRDRD